MATNDNNAQITFSATINTGMEVQRTRVIAFTSGKGGVGKTSLSVNLAIALARSDSKVCLFDADMGMANVNIMLGITPAWTLEHLFTDEKSIQDLLLTGPGGLDIVPGASGFAKCVDLDSEQQQRLVEAIEYLESRYDYLVIDTSAGISSTVLHFVAAAQMAAIVITPEPTSLTDAFSLLKVLRRRGYKRAPQVVVNMAQSASKAEKIYRRFEAAVKKYIGLETEYLGSVWMDESIRASVTLQRPVSLLPETDPSCKSFYRLADSLDSAYSRGRVPNLSFTTYWKKVVERSRKRRTHSTAEITAPVGKTADNSTCLKEVGLQESGHQTEDKHLEPIGSSSEDQWIDLRVRLNRFLKNDDTTPEQVITLLSSCIFTYGDQLGEAANDLLHGLLQVIDPKALSEEQRSLIVQNLERLRGVEGDNNEQQHVQRGASIQFGQSNNPHQAPNPRDPDQSVNIAQPKHRYDEKGFGCQDKLVEKIKASSGKVSLDNLLESIKYASLVDS